jgi:hypothetical protein
MLMKFPTRLGNLIFSAEQYRLALKFKFKAFLRNFKQLVRAPAADKVPGLVIVYDVIALGATEITTITLSPGHGLSLLDFCTDSFASPAQWGAAPKHIATINTEKMLIAPASGMIGFAALSRCNVCVDH